jgi:hypothetical protein
MGRTKCASCKYGDWKQLTHKCGKCVGFNKWKPVTEPKDPPKPIYIGHRE